MKKKPTPKPPSSKYPPIPKVIDAPGGRVKVQFVKKIVSGGHECWGLWEDHTRTISLSIESTPRHHWKVFFHEWSHVAITDAGLDDILDEKTHEALCNAFAAARMRERFGG